jgi:gallate dioxygenase
MARIIGGIGTSHVPTIGMAFDKGKQNDPDWKPLFEGYVPVAKWLTEQKPDVLVYFFNDHATTFFFDFYPTFAMGVAEEYPIADEGMGPRPVPALKGHVGLSRHIAQSLVYDEFDMTIFQDRALDHGCNSPLSMMWPPAPEWPGKIVPIAINVLQHPLPTAMRCYKLGQAVRRAILSYPEDLKVVVIGTGGLSHQMNGSRGGFNNTDWDMKFLELIDKDPAQLTAMSHADYARLGGTEGAEEIMWLAMRGALSDQAHMIHHNYYLPMTTAMAVALFEEPITSGPAEPPKPQLAGIEELEGTHLFDLAASTKAMRLNRFLHGMTVPAKRDLFRTDPEEAMAQAGLSNEEKRMIRELDWDALIRYGASFFTMEKFARIVKVSNPEIVAAMRGETLETFLKTRNVPGAR